MIPWRIEFHANPDGTGALIDADVGGEPVLVISNHANSSIVVPSTLMPRVSQGIYEYDQTNDVPGQTYDVTYTVTVDGQTVTWNGKSRTSGVDAWYYSDRAGVATVLDAATIAVTWDLDDANGEDAGAMVQDGVKADGYIDLFLGNAGLDVPAVLTGTGAIPAHIASVLADASNHLTIWNGWKRRGLEELSSKTGRSSADIAGLMSGYKAYADELLGKIASSLGETEGGFESVDVIDSSEQCTVDENGATIPPVGWWL
jgi:hypothetical protein